MVRRGRREKQKKVGEETLRLSSPMYSYSWSKQTLLPLSTPPAILTQPLLYHNECLGNHAVNWTGI